MTGPQPELAERLDLALGVTARNLAAVLATGSSPPPFRAFGRQFAEAAMLWGCAGRVLASPSPEAHRALTAIAGYLEAGVRHPANCAMLRRLPRLAVGPVGLVHAFLTDGGVRDDVFHHEVCAALRSPYSRVGERLPFRELEASWVRWKVLPEAPEPSSRLSGRALIAGCPHPLYLIADDLDAVTHGLWYLTDFGQLPPARVDPPGLATLIDQMAAWQANVGAVGEVAELLAARTVLREPPSGHSEVAASLVDDHWAELAPVLRGVRPARVHDATIQGLLCALRISTAMGVQPRPVPSADDVAAFAFDGILLRTVRRDDRAEAARLVTGAEADSRLAHRSLALDEVRAFLRHQMPFREELPVDPATDATSDTIDADQQRATVRAVYDRAASDYGRHASAVFSRFGESLVVRAGVAPGMRVLDVGTGRGAALWPALKAVGPDGQVVGIDLSGEMVRHLGADLAEGGHTNAEARVMDAEYLAFEDRSFDAVLCAQALPFVPNPERALAEMFRVLRPGGVLAVATKAAFDRRWAWDSRLLAAYPHAQVRLVAVPFATSSQLCEGLTAAGFVDFTAALEELEISFEDLEEYWGYVWSTGLRASLDRLTPGELSDYRRSCEAELRRMAADGGIRQRYQVLLAAARRPSAGAESSATESTELTRAPA